MRVVLDTNVIISGIFWKGAPAQILELWANKKIEVLVTDKILHEYFLLLERMDPTNAIVNKWKIFYLNILKDFVGILLMICLFIVR
ncbi:MAG: putative toxin-antitoxin system toxin component, PIN family [Patescibacteria group bacterium]|jgi:putative PIN family toxin of toxin-antitoxin system